MIHLTLNLKKNAKKLLFETFLYIKKSILCQTIRKISAFSEYGSITKNAKECKGSNIIFLLGISVIFDRKNLAPAKPGIGRN